MVAGESVFSQKCAKVVNRWGGPLHNFTSRSCILLCFLKHKEKTLLNFVSLRTWVARGTFNHSREEEEEEEGDVLLSDSCAMSCSDRLW